VCGAFMYSLPFCTEYVSFFPFTICFTCHLLGVLFVVLLAVYSFAVLLIIINKVALYLHRWDPNSKGILAP